MTLLATRLCSCVASPLGYPYPHDRRVRVANSLLQICCKGLQPQLSGSSPPGGQRVFGAVVRPRQTEPSGPPPRAISSLASPWPNAPGVQGHGLGGVGKRDYPFWLTCSLFPFSSRVGVWHTRQWGGLHMCDAWACVAPTRVTQLGRAVLGGPVPPPVAAPHRSDVNLPKCLVRADMAG